MALSIVAIPSRCTIQRAEELQAKNETLKQLIGGEWVECDAVMVAMGIDFATGLKMFDFSRTEEWNAKPLNGQKVITKFRLKRGAVNETY